MAFFCPASMETSKAGSGNEAVPSPQKWFGFLSNAVWCDLGAFERDDKHGLQLPCQFQPNCLRPVAVSLGNSNLA